MTGPTPAARLSITPAARLWFSPIEWLNLLGPLPPGVAMVGGLAEATVVVAFVSNVGSIRWLLDTHRGSLGLPLALWICCPTLPRSDFNRGSLNATLAAHGLHVVEEIPFDASWTALRVRHQPPVPHG
jgi:hypothetical protein